MEASGKEKAFCLVQVIAPSSALTACKVPGLGL